MVFQLHKDKKAVLLAMLNRWPVGASFASCDLIMKMLSILLELVLSAKTCVMCCRKKESIMLSTEHGVNSKIP